MHSFSRSLSLAALAKSLAFHVTPALAQGKGGGGSTAGVITIDQAKAEAGGITPGDAPGFPVTISQPGSYRLMGNLTVADVNLDGIEIKTNGGVTIDLNGFVVRGARCGEQRCTINPPPSNGINGLQPNFRVFNGTVENFGWSGIYAAGGAVIERVTAASNGYYGMVSNGSSQIIDSVARDNLGLGIAVLSGTVRGSLAHRNGIGQLRAANGAVLVSGNTLLGPLPLDGGGSAGPVSLGDNLCAPNYAGGQKC